MRLPPDPVEDTADELDALLRRDAAGTPQFIVERLEGMPATRRVQATSVLIGEYLAFCLENSIEFELAPFIHCSEDAVEEAKRNALAYYAPRSTARIPVFGGTEEAIVLDKPIGSGAFSSVWSIAGSSGAGAGAIKLPWPLDSGKPWHDRLSVLSNEIDLLSTLDHPNIVGFVRCITDGGGVRFLITERLTADTLRSIDKPVAVKAAVTWTAQVAAAADYLRRCQIVHRDISPANVGIDADGNAKLFDLGLAVRVQDRLDHDREKAGTPGFMTTDQIIGVPAGLDSRTDLAAIGFILFELLTGEAMIDEPTPDNMFAAWMTGSLMARCEDRRLPAIVRPILARCVATHPENRYPTPAELADDLKRISKEQDL